MFDGKCSVTITIGVYLRKLFDSFGKKLYIYIYILQIFQFRVTSAGIGILKKSLTLLNNVI